MEYLLMLYVNEAGWLQMTKEQQERGMAAYAAYTESLKKAGALKASGRLVPSLDAKTVRSREGKEQVLDGPFADAKEQIGGFYLIEAPDLKAALAWAAKCPATGHGVVEVRQLAR
jgi:hypothetical protein